MKMYENVENAIKYVLASCEEVRDTHEYSRRFSELSESTANESVKEDLALLARVCSPILDFRKKGTPYVPHINLSDGRRTPVPEDLTDSELRRLSEMLPGIDDARLSARIADVLWIRKFGRDKCQSYRDLAIDRYLAVPINAMSWIAGGGEVSLRRAVALAREDKRRREEILVRISVVVQSSLFGDCGIMMLCPLAQFLLDYNLPNVENRLSSQGWSAGFRKRMSETSSSWRSFMRHLLRGVNDKAIKRQNTARLFQRPAKCWHGRRRKVQMLSLRLLWADWSQSRRICTICLGPTRSRMIFKA